MLSLQHHKQRASVSGMTAAVVQGKEVCLSPSHRQADGGGPVQAEEERAEVQRVQHRHAHPDHRSRRPAGHDLGQDVLGAERADLRVPGEHVQPADCRRDDEGDPDLEGTQPEVIRAI